MLTIVLLIPSIGIASASCTLWVSLIVALKLLCYVDNSLCCVVNRLIMILSLAWKYGVASHCIWYAILKWVYENDGVPKTPHDWVHWKSKC